MEAPQPRCRLRDADRGCIGRQGKSLYCGRIDNRIRKVDPAGIISTYAGTGIPGYSGDRGPAASAQLNFPTGIALDAKGNMYVADEGNSVVRRIAVDGTINTVAGNGNPKFAGDNGPATSAQFDPVAVAVDSTGQPVHCRWPQLSDPQSGHERDHHDHRRHWNTRGYRRQRPGGQRDDWFRDRFGS